MDWQRTLRSKVPQITALFWIVKLLTTAMGEAMSDFLVKHINPFVVAAFTGLALAAVLVLQLAARRYVPWLYWLTVSMVAVFGTVAADGLHIQLHVAYAASTTFFAIVLAIVFFVWQRVERTLSIHSITTSRRELFYWATVLATFALGTAAGDLAANTLGLGYFTSILLFLGLMLIPVVGFWKFGLHEVPAFWFAYVLTRPVGASVADYLSKPKIISGLGLGDGVVALGFAVVIVALVAYLTLTHADTPREDVPGAEGLPPR